MPRSTTFAHYLMGHAPFKRAPFFYAYAGMWLHLLISTGILALSAARDWLSIFAALVVGSLCMGLVLLRPADEAVRPADQHRRVCS